MTVLWVWIFLGIALAGLVSMVGWAVWLFHKAADVYSEIQMLGRRGQELADLLGQLDLGSLEDAPDAPTERFGRVEQVG